MKSYTMKKVNGTPDWNTIPVIAMDTFMWTDPVDITAQSQICWDENYIYVRQEAVEPHIKMGTFHPLSTVCSASCLEFFFRPTEREEYINIEYNPVCSVWLGYGMGIKDRFRMINRDVNKRFQTQVEFTSNGWVLTYQIPMNFIQMFFPEFSPKEGLKMHGNVYKCGKDTVEPHYLVWNPIAPGAPSFHRIECFGELIFGGVD